MSRAINALKGYLNSVPSPVRHFVIGLASTVALVGASHIASLANITTMSDVKLVFSGIGVSTLAAVGRYFTQNVPGLLTPPAPPTR